MNNETSPFFAIINGEIPGKIVTQDDSKRFAIIEALEPEAAVHWLAVPYEYGFGTEEMEQKHQQRFLDLVDYAIRQTKSFVGRLPYAGKWFLNKIPRRII